MSVQDRELVDMISIDEPTRTLCLTMVEPRAWSDDHVRAVELEAKLNQYLHYLASNQVRRDYPDADERPKRIELVCHFEPPESFWPTLAQIETQLRRLDLSFRVLVSKDGKRPPQAVLFSERSRRGVTD